MNSRSYPAVVRKSSLRNSRPFLNRLRSAIFLSFSFLAVILSRGCKDGGVIDSGNGKKPCISDQPIEDTTRVYRSPDSGDTLKIYPWTIFVRFYPWVTDTSKILQLIQNYNLALFGGTVFEANRQLIAIACVNDPKRRAEYYFTPYAKSDFCGFGSDSLVEYSFGLFDETMIFPSGNILFRFVDGTSQKTIDSLFDANGLRFLWTTPDFPSGTIYLTTVTPKAKKNVLDLGFDLKGLPFAQYVSTDMAFAQQYLSCRK